MAQKTLVILEDDLDGGKADETVAFSLDGSSYEIDLSAKNAAKFRELLTPYIVAARSASGRGRRRRGAAAARTRSGETAEIRAWARAQGREISERGRIPSRIIEEYRQANR